VNNVFRIYPRGEKAPRFDAPLQSEQQARDAKAQQQIHFTNLTLANGLVLLP
jgi:hypothetical protein